METLTLSKIDIKKVPAALLSIALAVQSRTEIFKKIHIEANTYKDLAYFITGLGFIALRYDKRG